MFNDKKIAIVYDWLDKWGGVERVLLTLAKIFPQANFYTSYYDSNGAKWAKSLSIKTSFIQKLPSFIKKSRILSVPFYPFAFESLDFNQYHLVISVTSAFAKGIITKPPTKHLCYLLTPTRYLWILKKDYFTHKQFNFFINHYLNYLKKWDYVASQRPDKIVSISKTVANRCKNYYHRPSDVVYPPFDLNYWQKIKEEVHPQNNKFKINNFFLVVSRLEPYKKINLVINVFNKLKKNLVIVGEGSQENQLKKIAKKEIFFYKKLTDSNLAYLYTQANGLIMPQEEDFGYISLEAQFFDCPVIAYKNGGALETVLENKTGIFFLKQTEEDLKDAIERYEKIKYNLKNNLLKKNINHLKKFDINIFKEKFLNLIKKFFN